MLRLLASLSVKNQTVSSASRAMLSASSYLSGERRRDDDAFHTKPQPKHQREVIDAVSELLARVNQQLRELPSSVVYRPPFVFKNTNARLLTPEERDLQMGLQRIRGEAEGLLRGITGVRPPVLMKPHITPESAYVTLAKLEGDLLTLGAKSRVDESESYVAAPIMKK